MAGPVRNVPKYVTANVLDVQGKTEMFVYCVMVNFTQPIAI
jgi:hypothetical protein